MMHKSSWKIGLITLGLLPAIGWAQTTQPAKPAPVLEYKKEVLQPSTPRMRPPPPPGAEWPTKAPAGTVCMIRLPVSKQYIPPIGGVAANAREVILSKGNQLSVEQRKLLQNQKATGRGMMNVEESGNYITFELFAVSEPDVRHMAEVLVEWINTNRRAEGERIREAVEEQEKTNAEDREQIPKLAQELETLKTKIEGLKRIVPVTDQKAADSYLIELQKLHRSITIEIAGIQAKIDMIAKIRNRDGYERAQQLRLDELQAAQDVEMAGALVRKNLTETDLKNIKEYNEANHREAELNKDLPSKKVRLARNESPVTKLARSALLEQASEWMEPMPLSGPLTIFQPATAADAPPMTQPASGR